MGAWTEIDLPYGDDCLTARVPTRRLIGVLEPPWAPAASASMVDDALAHPIGSGVVGDAVRPGDRVALLISDITRVTRSDQLLPPLLNALNQAGVPDRRIVGVFANGFHRPHTPEERRAVVGDEVAARIALVDHATTEPMTSFRPTSRGTPVAINKNVADADRRILTGGIVHHWIAGYGGGRKAILPGVAAYETNVANHALMLEPGSGVGVLAGNPVHEDMIEAVAQLRPDLLLNSVVSPAGMITDIVAGDWIAAHEAGCAVVDRRLGTALAERAEVVVASCGGYPRDINVYQAQKALENALRAAKPGGAVILVAECRDGHGSAPFLDWMRRYQSTAELEARLRREFVLGAHKAFGYARLLDRARVILVSALPDTLVRDLWLKPAGSVEAALAMLDGEGTIAVMPHAAITYPLIREQAAA